jgi:hypothetical protein
MSIPKTWVTVYTGDMGNLACGITGHPVIRKGLCETSRRPVRAGQLIPSMGA